MKYSIIVPVYNSEKYIKTCVDSLLSQKIEDYEIILVDDGSTDESPIICDEYERETPRIRVIHQNNQGLIGARKTGILNANAEYVLFCDSDDYWSSDLLNEVDNAIELSSADIVIFGANIVRDNNQEALLWRNAKTGIVFKEEVFNELIFGCSITSMCMKACRTKLFENNYGCSANQGHDFGEDTLESVLLTKKADTIYYLKESLYNYRKGSGMTSRFAEDYFKAFKLVNREIKALLTENDLPDCRLKLDYHLLMRAYDAVGNMAAASRANQRIIEDIAKDEVFIDSYQHVMTTEYRELFNAKEKTIIDALYNRDFRKIKAFIFLKRSLNRY